MGEQASSVERVTDGAVAAIKRNSSGTVQFSSVASGQTATGITAGTNKTITATTKERVFFIKAKCKVKGLGTKTGKAIVKFNAGGTASSAGAGTTTVTNTWSITTTKPNFTATGTATAGTGSMTATFWVNDTILVP